MNWIFIYVFRIQKILSSKNFRRLFQYYRDVLAAYNNTTAIDFIKANVTDLFDLKVNCLNGVEDDYIST